MIPLSLADVAAATGGHLADGARPEAVVTGPVLLDSRAVTPGALFVAVRGERVDGADYAPAADAAGAVATLAARPTGVPTVVVDDVQAALGALAATDLRRSDARVVGVTGSSGKTSTKDLLAHLFTAAGPTVAAEGSFNNEYGLPLTVLRVEAETQTLVLEYSARGTGHIAYLCGIAPPSIAIVLNVGTAHLGEFGSREGIARAKGELVAALPADGVAVLNADDPLVLGMRERTAARVVTFGTGSRSDVDVAATDLSLDALAQPTFTLRTAVGETARVTLPLSGAHHAANAAAATAAALAAGLSLEACAQALRAARPRSPHRMQVLRRPDGLLVLDDAYNANPDSVRAGLAALVRMGGQDAGERRRTWAVLGPMRELGEDSGALHEEVGAAAAALGVDEVLAVGPDAQPIAAAAGATAGWAGRARTVATAADATALLLDEVRPADVVLAKASKSERLWEVAEALVESAERARTERPA